MPTYSYACTQCGDRFDAVQAFSDDALTTCTKCSGRLRKIFGNVGVVFKGSGFYRNDSRADTNTSNGAKSPAKSSGSGGSESGGSESSSSGSSSSGSSGSGSAGSESSGSTSSSSDSGSSSTSSTSAPAAAATS